MPAWPPGPSDVVLSASIADPSGGLPHALRSTPPLPPQRVVPSTRFRIGLHATPDPKGRLVISLRGKVGAPHPDECEVTDRVERHEVKRGPEFTDSTVAVTEVGRHPSAPNPGICQQRVERQRPLEPLVRVVEAMQQYKRAAAESQRQRIIGREPMSLFREPIRPTAIGIGGRAKTVRRALRPTPGGGCLRQSVARGKFLRAKEALDRGIALEALNRESERQSAEREPNRLVDLSIGMLRRSTSRPPHRHGWRFPKRPAVVPGKPAKLAEAICSGHVRDGGLCAGLQQLLTRTGQPHPPHPAKRRGTQECPEMGLECAGADPSDIGEAREVDRLRQMVPQPVQSAHQVTW